MRVLPVLLVVAFAATPPHLAGQHQPAFIPSVAAPRPTPVGVDCCRAEDAVLSTLGAALGGVAGFYGLGFAGLLLTGGNDVCGDDPCGLVGGILGAVLGEAIGIGLGAHLGGGAKGDVWAAIGASLGVLVAGGMATDVLDLGESMVVVVPVAQIAMAVWAELMTGSRKNGRT